MIYYFVPSDRKPTIAQLRELNLSYAFEDKSFTAVEVKPGCGPDGQTGFLLSSSGSPDYVPDKQSWHQHSKPGVYFGWWNSQRPTPDNFRRSDKHIIHGRMVELADGNHWEIPIARKWSTGVGSQEGEIVYENPLTRRLEFNDGEWVEGDVINQHVLFNEIGRSIFDHWTSQPDKTSFLLPNNYNQLCADIVSMNYRLSAFEISALGLLTSDPSLIWSILKEVIDMTGWVELIKKKADDERSSTVGSTDLIPDTDQPMQI